MGSSNSEGVNEPAIRRQGAVLGNEAYLNRIWALIDREAKRAKVDFWLAQACLVNGVDPATRRAA